MDRTDEDKQTEDRQTEEKSFLTEIKTLIAQQSAVQKDQLNQHLKKHDGKLEQEFGKAFTKINEKLDEKIKTSLAPFEQRQSNSEQQIEILKTQMNKHLQTSEENTKTILVSNQHLTKTLAEIHFDTS